MQAGAEVQSEAERRAQGQRGFYFALSAYIAWGLLPLYLKLVAHIPPVEVVAHRVLWSVPVAGIILLILGRTRDVATALRSPRMLGMAMLTAGVISINWGTYVWAISNDRVLETALGYYINPLVSMLLGAVFLGERFSRLQSVAILLAVLAVTVLTIETGGLPWVSLVLAFSFAIYGYLRKTLPIGPSQGFFLEVLLLLPFCLVYLVWLQATGNAHFLADGGGNVVLLMLAGPLTAIPLVLYAFGAKLLRISTIGIMQYIAPTIVALMAVFLFGEPFGMPRMIAFTLIWVALAIYSWPLVFNGRKR